jgi:hypothetical protein
MNINLHIERLVLEGLPLTRAQGPVVQRAVELELTRLFAVAGIGAGLRSGGMIPRATGDAMQFERETTPRQLGTQIAQSVHGGLSK